MQDDWRVNDRLTLNYGVRLEHETGLMEQRQPDRRSTSTQTAVSPLNSSVNVIDPITGAAPHDPRRPGVRRRQNGAPTAQGNQPAVKAAPRVGAVYSLNEKTVLRGGWGLYYSPWNYPAAGTNGWGQIGYSATTDVPQSTRQRADRVA